MEALEGIYALIIAIITALGGTAAWRFYDNRARQKARERSKYNDILRSDYRDRIESLESKLKESNDEKDYLWEQLLELNGQVAELNVKVKFLEDENERLMRELKRERESQ